MRVSPCAWVMDATTDELPSEVKRLAQLSAEVTHNHPEGIKGAMATADAILCAVISLAVMVAITLRRLKDVSRNISRKSMDMTFRKR